MDIHELDLALSITDGKLTLTANTLPNLLLQPLLSAYNADQPLIIANAQKETTTTTVTVTGSSPFIRVPSLVVTALFYIDATGTPVAELRFTLIGQTPGPNAWRFSTSFPDIPLFMDYNKSLTTPQSKLLDKLQLSNASFVLRTQAGNDPTTGVPLIAGLNFIASLKPTGIAGLFDTLLDGNKQVTVYGSITTPITEQITPLLPTQTYPWQVQWAVPGIDLQADLGINVVISKLTLDHTTLRIYTPLTSDWLAANSSYQPIIAIAETLQVPSANISVATLVEITRNYAYTAIVGTFQGVTLDNLSHLADLANGTDLVEKLPGDIQKALTTLKGLSLERASIGFSSSLSPEAVDYVSFTIGIPQIQWTIFSGMTVDNLFVDFIINSPFAPGRSITALVGGTIDAGGVLLDVITQVPDFTVWAELQDGTSLPLSAFFKKYVSELPAPPDLAVDETQFLITPGQEYLFTASMADDPPWTIDLGPTPLTISDVRIELSKQASNPPQATFNGTLQIGQALILTTNYTLPGSFFIRADLPEVKLSSVIALLNELDLALPTGFDIDFTQAYVLIERIASDLSFSIATNITSLGLLAFTVRRQSKWGFALGVDLSVSGLAALPGLSALAPFESFVGLETLMLVISSLDNQTGFQFPDMANFNVPSLGTKNLQLPPQASGLTRGLNIYAMLSTSKSAGFQALAKYLGIKLNGTIGITLAISLPDPVTNSKIFLAVNEEIQKGTTLTGELGGLLQGSDVGAFLTAIVHTQVQQQPIEFDVTAVVLEDGVLISGTMKGTIKFDAVQLSNLALIIGLDFEGVPSLGIAATLDISTFDTSLAIFFNSTDPVKSLVAGAISNVTLLNIVEELAAQKSIPAGLGTVLGLIGLKALKAFNMPTSVAPALDNRNISAIADAFKQYGNISIPGSSDRILLIISKQSALWYLTDMSTMQHYSLALAGNTIAVTLQPQLYIAPATTFIGSIQYPQGFDIMAEIDYLLIKAQIKIIINTNQGISADAHIDPITLLNQNFFSITGANGLGGPQLSLATYSQPQLTDPQLRDPHFLLSGNLRLLGADMAGIYILISEHGLIFNITAQVNPLLHVDLKGNFDSLTNISVGGTIVVGINRALNLGQLGSVQVNTNVDGTLTVSYTGKNPSATFLGSFVFQGIQCNVPQLMLDVNTPALQTIGDKLWEQITDIITKLLKDSDQWLKWVHSGIIQGVSQTAEQIGQILASVYHLSADDIASKTKQILGYGISDITKALKGAGSTANEAVNALKNLGYQAADIASAISNTFTNTHADTNIGHIDTPAGPHGDAASQHVDVPGTHADSTGHVDVPRSHIDSSSHIDIPGTHTDSNTIFGHADTNLTPHGDSNPHVDQTTTPHGDSNPHVDQTTTPHGDSSTPHADAQIPHGDTNTHVDVN